LSRECKIANRGQLDRKEEVGNTKAIGYSKEDEEKKKMHRDVRYTCHTANTGKKESVLSLNFQSTQIINVTNCAKNSTMNFRYLIEETDRLSKSD